MKKWLSLICCALLALTLAACTPQNAATSSSQQKSNGTYAEITDDLGRKITLTEKPQRVVVLATSLMNFSDAVDGDLVGRPTVMAEGEKAPARYENVPEMGAVYNASIEKILSVKPDLVFASSTQHQKLIPLLEQNNIPVIALKTKTYDDVKRNMTIMGQVYGKEDVAKQKLDAMDKQIQAIVAKVPDKNVKLAILHATPSHVTVEGNKTIAGCVADIIGFNNVVADDIPDGTERVPYSMESLIQKDPDYIFITSMGKVEKIQNRLKQDVEGNSSWQTLRAVQQGHVIILPENLFLLNPGFSYPDAVKYMVQAIYPEVAL